MTEVTPSISSDKGANAADLSVNKTTEVEVKVGDKSVKVDPLIAEALKLAQKAAEDAGVAVTSLRAQLTEKDAALAAASKPAMKKAPEGDGLDVLLFTDPDKAIQLITENIMAKVDAKQSQTSAQEMFWKEFYKENKDLEDMDAYVRYVFQRDFPEMKKSGITVGEAIKKLGTTVKGELIKVSTRSKGQGKPIAEGGSEGNSGRNTESELEVSKDSPTTTGQILRARREARAEAKQPGRRAAKS